MNKLLIALCTLALMASCQIYINDDGYRFMSDEQKAHVVPLTTSIDEVTNDGYLYKINIDQMKEFLAHHDRVVIYEYLTYCKSEYCLLPSAIEDKCIEHGITPLIVLEEYHYAFDIPKMNSPLLIVDKSNYNNKMFYCKKFFDELTNSKIKTRGYGRYFYFRNGEFVKCFEDFLSENFDELD